MEKLDIRTGMKFKMLSRSLLEYLGPEDVFDFSGNDEFTNNIIRLFKESLELTDELFEDIPKEALNDDLIKYFFDNDGYYQLEITGRAEDTPDAFCIDMKYNPNFKDEKETKLFTLIMTADDIRGFLEEKIMVYDVPKFFFMHDDKLCAAAPIDLQGDYVELFRNEDGKFKYLGTCPLNKEKTKFELDGMKFYLKDFYRDI
jgi:hypothetical protein